MGDRVNSWFRSKIHGAEFKERIQNNLETYVSDKSINVQRNFRYSNVKSTNSEDYNPPPPPPLSVEARSSAKNIHSISSLSIPLPPPSVRNTGNTHTTTISEMPPDPEDEESLTEFEEIMYSKTGKRGTEVRKEMNTLLRRLGRTRNQFETSSIDINKHI
uniref:Uncharacterized protein n=1 Tax=Aplanochytrium stocchinoi TaxID=215587 RepID=A0A7S3LLB8_9STRA